MEWTSEGPFGAEKRRKAPISPKTPHAKTVRAARPRPRPRPVAFFVAFFHATPHHLKKYSNVRRLLGRSVTRVLSSNGN